MLLAAAVLLAAAGCAGTGANAGSDGMNMGDNGFSAAVPIKVEIGIEPAAPGVGESVRLLATVAQGDETVDDADEVKFEIWRDGDTKHEEIPAKPQGKGEYAITTTFQEAGTYHVISHVTARGMHTMPEREFTVK